MIPFLFIGTTEIIVIAIVVILFFGASKIPTLMRNLGSGVKSFKDGMRDGALPEEEKKEETKKD